MLRYSNQNQADSSRMQTLTQKLEAVKNSPELLNKLLNEMGDVLLKGKPCYVNEYVEFKNACEHLVELKNEDDQFYQLFIQIYGAHYNNKDDLEYVLQKRRFHHHFLFSENTEESKAIHMNILRDIVDTLFLFDNKINLRDNPTSDEVLSLRVELLKWQKWKKFFNDETNIALTILAKYWPINADCYITLDEIPPLERVFITAGHQFNLPALIEYNSTRRIRTDFGDTENSRKVLAPNTREPLSDFDAIHVLALHTNKIFTNGYKHSLESLYDYQFTKIAAGIRHHLSSCSSGCFSNDHHHIRLARLPEPVSNQLLRTIKENPFVMRSLEVLLKSGMSIEQFAGLDPDKQIAMCYVRNSVHFPYLTGLNLQGLVKLNADNIKKLFSLDPDDDGIDDLVNHSSIADLNSRIDEMALLDEQARNSRRLFL